MNAPDKCPRCGVEVLGENSSKSGFRMMCDSIQWKGGIFRQSDDCLSFERDQLAARVKELESERGEFKRDCAAALDRVEEWRAYAGRLEEVGMQLSFSVVMLQAFIEANGWETDTGNESVKQWEKAKETKP